MCADLSPMPWFLPCQEGGTASAKALLLRHLPRQRHKAGSRWRQPFHAAHGQPGDAALAGREAAIDHADRKSTRLNSSHSQISYAVFCLKKKKNNQKRGAL